MFADGEKRLVIADEKGLVLARAVFSVLVTVLLAVSVTFWVGVALATFLVLFCSQARAVEERFR